MLLVRILLSSLVAASHTPAETSPELNTSVPSQRASTSQSNQQKWFWKKTGWGGGFGGGLTTIGNDGARTTLFYTSFFAETLPGPAITESFTLPGFTTTILTSQDTSPDTVVPNGITEAATGAITSQDTPQGATTLFTTASSFQVSAVTLFTTIPTTLTINQF